MAVGFTIDVEKCTECLRCSGACSLVKTGKVQISLSHIVIEKKWPKTPEIWVCRFDDCEKPCIEACPTEAISIKDGIVVIDPELCTGCNSCVEVCPYKAIYLNNNSIAVKCDFCGGDPACVKECVTGALKMKEGSR